MIRSTAALLGLVWAGAAGIAAGVWLRVDVVVVIFGIAAVGGLARRRSGVVAFAGVFSLGLISGQAVTSPGGASNPLAEIAREVPHCTIEGRITEHAGGLGTLIGARRAVCDGREPMLDAGVVIVDVLDHDPGTAVMAEGWLVPFGVDEWDRARARTPADVALEARRVEVVGAPTGLLGVAAAVRASLIRSTGDLDGRTASLIRGLTVGDTSDMDEATKHEFRRTGLSHLVAVSGSNVAIILGAVATMVRRLPLSARTLVCFAALAFYVVVVGPEPSVLRAAAMGTVMLAGLLWGRRSEPLQALGMALIVLLAFRPELVSSVGLHLSAGATAGIVLWGRALSETLGRVLPKPVAYVLGATLAAQIAVAPLIALVFGEISLVAPVANLLAIVAVAPATILGLAAAFVGLAAPPAGALIGRAAGPFAGWIVGVAQTLARLPWAAVACPPWVGWSLAVAVGLAVVVTVAGGASGGASRALH